MTLLALRRVLPAEPFADLVAYREVGGGTGLEAARRLGSAATIDDIELSGLRGRGGAGFPTGTKWRTVASYASAFAPATVVVNGAEGEPGSFKDRAIMARNPYAVLEGALIAALAVGADRAIVAIKSSFEREATRLRSAIAEITAAGWCEGVTLAVVTGPGEYLFGEETALLEVLDGRPPFPRIAPPYRHGVDEIGPHPEASAGSVLAETEPGGSPPTLVNNVETMANVAGIMALGPAWFREVGTVDSPGTIVCTITGATARHGVAEVAMGTTLAEVIAEVGGGPVGDARLVAAMSGVSNALVPADLFDTPLTYEAMRAIGSGLGAAGFIVFDDRTDLVTVAASASRFLAVESCGQCTPCKQDGLAIATHLERLASRNGDGGETTFIEKRLRTVADSARCFLATQHQVVIGSFLQLFPDALSSRAPSPSATGSVGTTASAGADVIAPIVDLVNGVAVLDLDRQDKRPDWTHGGAESGQTPVERLGATGPDLA